MGNSISEAAIRLGVLVAISAALTPMSVRDAAAGALAPHRALYSMHLSKSSGDGGLSAARGVMTYEFRDQCDGWTVESRVYLRLQYDGSKEIENVRSLMTWESKDGLGFRFRVNESQNGKPVQEIKGVAVLDGEGEGGVVEYSKPTRNKVNLPKGTLFPTAHINALITLSAGGGNHLTKSIFDGATLDNPYEVSAVIGKDKDGPKLSKKVLEKLADTLRWRARLAYFPVRDKSSTPEMELGVEFRADGIVETILQDFGDYGVEARLDQIEMLEKPGC